MDTNDAKPMFSFIPKSYIKEKQEIESTKEEVELPIFEPQMQQKMAVDTQPPIQESQSMPIDSLIAKIDNLENLLLQKQVLPQAQSEDEIINQLRANTLQIAKLGKEIRQIDAQNATVELNSEMTNVLNQLRSTTLYLSKIDRKIDHVLNSISMMQDKEQTDNSMDMSYQPRAQALLLSKLERKMNELLYHYSQK